MGSKNPEDYIGRHVRTPWFIEPVVIFAHFTDKTSGHGWFVLHTNHTFTCRTDGEIRPGSQMLNVCDFTIFEADGKEWAVVEFEDHQLVM